MAGSPSRSFRRWRSSTRQPMSTMTARSINAMSASLGMIVLLSARRIRPGMRDGIEIANARLNWR